MIGNVAIGGGAPIVVQSMTNTDTADVAATVAQVKALADAGSEIVRITVNTTEARPRSPKSANASTRWAVRVPLVGDFHFNGHKLLTESPECAQRARQIPHQSRQRGQGQQARPAVRGDDRAGDRARQARAHRRQLGQPRCRRCSRG